MPYSVPPLWSHHHTAPPRSDRTSLWRVKPLTPRRLRRECEQENPIRLRPGQIRRPPSASPCGSDPSPSRTSPTTTPAESTRTIEPEPHKVTHQAPSSVATPACGFADRSGSGNSVMFPSTSIRPSCSARISTNRPPTRRLLFAPRGPPTLSFRDDHPANPIHAGSAPPSRSSRSRLTEC